MHSSDGPPRVRPQGTATVSLPVVLLSLAVSGLLRLPVVQSLSVLVKNVLSANRDPQ